MCGDTGASINPGPIDASTDIETGEVNFNERFLSEIDPDLNYFNNAEYNFSNFNSYTIDELKDTNINTSGGFNIMHHNCRSILSHGKLDNYYNLLDLLGNPFDIIGLTETWLNASNVNTPMFNEYKYNHVYQTRTLDNFESKERGGGLSLFIRDNILYKLRDDLSVLTSYLELLFVEINLNNKIYLIGVTYRIPNTNIKLFTDEINSILEKIRTKYEVFLMGDFNICLLYPCLNHG